MNEFGSVIGVVDNTQSIYYTSEEGRNDNFQMTIHNCFPASVLLGMIRAP
jgi:hypothetical protein